MTFDTEKENNTENGISSAENCCISMNYSEILNKCESTDMNKIYP